MNGRVQDHVRRVSAAIHDHDDEPVAIDLLEQTTDIVSAYVSHNALSVSDLPKLITDVHTSLRTLSTAAALTPPAEPAKPAVPLRSSVKPDHLVCLHDGKKFKSLKRHLMTHHSQTPQQYRNAFGLPSDYPMVAPNYSATRSSLAKSSGLGRKVPPTARGKSNGAAAHH
jgi:predicted transcriptional regulator